MALAAFSAAMDSGVATRPIADFDAYRAELELFVYRSGQLMRPVFERARKATKAAAETGGVRVAYAEGDDERVLRAVQTVVDEGLCKPVLIGKRETITAKAAEMGLRLDFDHRVEILDPSVDRALFAPLVERYQGDRKSVV